MDDIDSKTNGMRYDELFSFSCERGILGVSRDGEMSCVWGGHWCGKVNLR